tara:strand:+ start:125 stop:1498 length:1374 start_codon:yes stop_codon:yes gene_type:complete
MKKDEIKNLNILVVGDIILDKYISGNTNRISPEAPIPVLDVEKTYFRLGGAANVAHNLKSIGVNSFLIGRISNDANGNILENLINDYGINNLLIKQNISKTTCKTRVICSSQQIVRIDDEEKVFSDKSEEDFVSNQISKYKFDCIIISDYNKGFINSKIVSILKKAKVNIIVDPKPSNILFYKDVHSITPNFNEAKLISDKNNIDEIGLNIKRQTNSNVLITRGKKGVSIFERKISKALHISARVNEVIDVSGAGDTFISVYSIFISLGYQIKDAAKIANNSCGMVIKKVGTSTIDFNELLTSNHGLISKQTEISSLSSLINGIDKKIVFTNGCFDILHKGHISLLKEAKSFGDILVVGLNSDKSVKINKGDKRPFNDETARIEVLSAISYVDYILLFEQETPIELIKELKPDVLVKGADYELNEVVGCDEVKKYGGVVKLAKIISGYSSTGLINKM